MDFIQWVTDARSVFTLICMITFLGIVVWAYSSAYKKDFDKPAMLPFADDESLTTKSQEPYHG